MIPGYSQRTRIGVAAKLIGVTPATIRRWLESGYLRGVRTPGNRWLVERDSIESLLTTARANENGN
jgi:excisionase family DNA binding protein